MDEGKYVSAENQRRQDVVGKTEAGASDYSTRRLLRDYLPAFVEAGNCFDLHAGTDRRDSGSSEAELCGESVRAGSGADVKVRWLDESMLTISGDTATVRREGSEPIRKARVGGAQQGRDASRHDSKLEASYELYLSALKHAGEIQAFWYHPITFHLPGGIRHKPDFVIWPVGSDRLKIHECKGWSKNLRDGMTRLHIAGGIFVCYEWSLVKQVKGQWEITAI